MASGTLSDRFQARKSLAVAGYALSAAAKPFFYVATTWPVVAGVRWVDRVGKGIRTAPRDALLADSTAPSQRGLAFGLHRAADTGGAVAGLLVAIFIVSRVQGSTVDLTLATFRTLVLVSLVPAFLAVAVLAIGAREVRPSGTRIEPARHFANIMKAIRADGIAKYGQDIEVAYWGKNKRPESFATLTP